MGIDETFASRPASVGHRRDRGRHARPGRASAAPRRRRRPATPSRRSWRRRHGDPFAVLGPARGRRRAAGRSAPCCRSAKSRDRCSSTASRADRRFERSHPAGFFVARVRGERAARSTELADRLARRRVQERSRPLQLRLDPWARGRSAHLREVGSDVTYAHPRRAARTRRRHRRASASPSGRRMPAASAWSATSTAGTAAAIPMRLWHERRRLGAVRPGPRRPASATSTRSAAPTARSCR